MDQVLRVLLLLIFGGGAMTAFAGGAVYWMEPHRRIARQLRKMLDGAADAVVAGPARGQGAALRLDQSRIAIVRDATEAESQPPRDPGRRGRTAARTGKASGARATSSNSSNNQPNQRYTTPTRVRLQCKIARCARVARAASTMPRPMRVLDHAG